MYLQDFISKYISLHQEKISTIDTTYDIASNIHNYFKLIKNEKEIEKNIFQKIMNDSEIRKIFDKDTKIIMLYDKYVEFCSKFFNLRNKNLNEEKEKEKENNTKIKESIEKLKNQNKQLSKEDEVKKLKKIKFLIK